MKAAEECAGEAGPEEGGWSSSGDAAAVAMSCPLSTLHMRVRRAMGGGVLARKHGATAKGGAHLKTARRQKGAHPSASTCESSSEKARLVNSGVLSTTPAAGVGDAESWVARQKRKAESSLTHQRQRSAASTSFGR